MSNLPNLYKLLEIAGKDVVFDTPEHEMVDGAYSELTGLLNHIEALKKSHEATSKALYHLQFVQHEELLNKYCALRDAMKALVEGMGYTVKSR